MKLEIKFDDGSKLFMKANFVSFGKDDIEILDLADDRIEFNASDIEYALIDGEEVYSW